MDLRVRWAVASLLACLAAGMAQGASLEAGAAKTVVTPDLRGRTVYLAGFGYNRPATGVHDNLWARCLALRAGNRNVVLCSVDLIGLFYDDVLKIRARVRELAPQVNLVIVAATHNHEGPDTLGLWGPTARVSGMDPSYLDRLDELVAQTAARAVRRMVPARLTLGREHNPLLGLLQDDSRPPYVKDPYLFALRLTGSANRRPIATLVNWSDHAETLGRKNREITSDYPHGLRAWLEENGGGLALFFNGSIGGLLSTLGNQVALLDPETGDLAPDGTWEKADLVGTMLGKLADRILRRGKIVPVDSLVIRQAVFFLPLANDRFRIAAGLGIFHGRKELFTAGKPDRSVAEKDIPGMGETKYATGQDLETEVDYLQLVSRGKVAAEVVTVPGEIYPELVNGGITRYAGADYPRAPFEPILRRQLKSRYQFIIGLGNDELGYLIPKAEWDDQPPWLLGRPSRWYGEMNSVGPDAAGTVLRALAVLTK
jgi:hypothetical protein